MHVCSTNIEWYNVATNELVMDSDLDARALVATTHPKAAEIRFLFKLRASRFFFLASVFHNNARVGLQRQKLLKGKLE